ncbi:unnamed protein product [Hymenolepis diminuta]|uniref:Uncharacterized protein n=1 Tax=Hymenolepis diminuta TaxID=6216 RepID=A0A564ZAP6_HYMDI|nr:unnamed protein product [Hymenolepis diminuta]
MRALIGRDDYRKRKGQCRQDWLIAGPTMRCLLLSFEVCLPFPIDENRSAEDTRCLSMECLGQERLKVYRGYYKDKIIKFDGD